VRKQLILFILTLTACTFAATKFVQVLFQSRDYHFYGYGTATFFFFIVSYRLGDHIKTYKLSRF